MALVEWVKLKALVSALESLDVKEIVDVIEKFGEKEFKNKKNDYLDNLRRKFASIVFEIGKRMERKNS